MPRPPKFQKQRGRLARNIADDKRAIKRGVIPLMSKTYGLRVSRDTTVSRDPLADSRKALQDLERVRRKDPELADAIEHEARARARVIKLRGAGARRGAHESYDKGVHALALTVGRNPRPGDIVKEGTAGGRILDGSIVVGSALLTVRLDEMIEARPLGLKPSTIKAILEALVLAIALLKRSRAVSRYAALSLTGTVGGKLVSAASKRGVPSP
jgi:hypothetical protein